MTEAVVPTRSASSFCGQPERSSAPIELHNAEPGAPLADQWGRMRNRGPLHSVHAQRAPRVRREVGELVKDAVRVSEQVQGTVMR